MLEGVLLPWNGDTKESANRERLGQMNYVSMNCNCLILLLQQDPEVTKGLGLQAMFDLNPEQSARDQDTQFTSGVVVDIQ